MKTKPQLTSRRAFMRNALIGIPLLGAAAYIGTYAPPIHFAEKSFPGENPTRRVLVTYASTYGSTGGIAEHIGKTISQTGAAADVRPLFAVNDLAQYQQVFIGSPIHGEKWLPEAVKFVVDRQSELASKQVAYFLSCMAIGLSKDTAISAKVARAFDLVKNKAPQVTPISLACFAGALDYSVMPLFMQGMYRLIAENGTSGDFRNWKKIADWTRQVHSIMGSKV